MAHFMGTVRGARGEASRLGSKGSGLRVTCRGWDDGVTVYASHGEQGDVFEVWSDGGSSGGKERALLATIIGGAIIPADRSILSALVALADECNGKLGADPYGVPAFRAACEAAGRAVGHAGDWMDGIDAARGVVQSWRKTPTQTTR